MKFVFVLIAISFLVAGARAADPEPYLKSAPMPFYPGFARSANIQGKVTVHFTVDRQGDTSGIEAVGGHELLRRYAAENVQNWKFDWSPPCACQAKKEAVFLFKLSGEFESAERPSVTVKWFKGERVMRIEVGADDVPLNTESTH